MTRMLFALIAGLAVIAGAASTGWAQPADERPMGWAVARAVLVDPTTFAPAAISYYAMREDWKTSQILFAHGWLEANPRFTLSGSPNDVPVSYAVGNARIRTASLRVLQNSALNNAAIAIAERALVKRYPSRRRLIRTVSWVERIGFAAVITYANSADHLRQAAGNRRIARDTGLSAR